MNLQEAPPTVPGTVERIDQLLTIEAPSVGPQSSRPSDRKCYGPFPEIDAQTRKKFEAIMSEVKGEFQFLEMALYFIKSLLDARTVEKDDIAEIYDKAAENRFGTAEHHRNAFANKAEWFRLRAQAVAIKDRSAQRSKLSRPFRI